MQCHRRGRGRSRCARLLFPCLTKPSSGHVPCGDRGDGRRPSLYSQRSHEARRSRGWVLPMSRDRLHGFRALVGTALRWYAIPSALPTVIPPAVYSSRRPTANPHGLRHNARPTSTRPVHRRERSRAGRSAPGTRHSLVAEAGCEWPSHNLRKHDKTNGPNLCGV